MLETDDSEAMREARRTVEVCNACRYCEGFCAVFPAMELRRSFDGGDLNHLANLCHGCRACYYACQYAPPHEFGINVPQSLAALRAESYAGFAWPRPLAVLFRRNGTVVSLAVASGIALVLLLAFALQPSVVMRRPHVGPGAFYDVIPWGTMAAVAGATFLFALLALCIGGVRFWRRAGGAGGRITARAVAIAAHDILTLRNLGGGGGGCNDMDEAFSSVRRRFHHAVFYGFLLCFAATVVATIYADMLGRPAPYALGSVPVLLGTIGGALMVVGTAGLIWTRIVADPAPDMRRLAGGGYALCVQLLLAALTGLLLLAVRETAAMPVLLAVHLGVVLSFFVTMPYGKFVHGLYRGLALLRAAAEHRQN